MDDVKGIWLNNVMPAWGRLRMAAKDDATGICGEDWTEVQRCVNELKDALEDMDAFMDDVDV